MPSSVNGIGTTYYGKRNLETETGTCEFCNREATLSTYETTHFFIVVFIPIIPLGKKQIIDDCSSCRRHRVTSAAEWQAVREEAIEKSTEQLSGKMDDPKVAIEHLQTLTAFKQMDDAKEFAEAVAVTHEKDFDVQFFLGAWHEKYSNVIVADKYFNKAFQLEPENPIAVRAKGLGLMQQGKLDEAQELLQTLRPPSKDFDPLVFYQLANCFQSQERHPEALELYKLINDQDVAFGHDKDFRKSVRRSEKAAGSGAATMLPKKSILFSKGFWWTAAAMGAVLAFLLSSFWLGTNRTVYLVNGIEKKIEFQIDDQSYSLRPGRQKEITLAEGSHEVTVTEPIPLETKSFKMSSSLLTRWFRKPAFVVDPTETAAVVWEEATYAERPVDEYDFDIKVGQLLTTYPHVDYQFEPFPQEVDLSSSSSKVKKTRISFQAIEPTALVGDNIKITPERKLEILENRIRFNADSSIDWAIYSFIANNQNQPDRAIKLMKPMVKKRPVDVPIHRVYQAAMKMSGRSDEVLSEYEKMFQDEPNDADNAYLLGRLQTSASGCNEFFKKALALDERHAHATFGLGYNELTSGNFDEARIRLEQAVQLEPENEEYLSEYIQALFAAKDYQALRTWIPRDPDNYSDYKMRANFLVLTNSQIQHSSLKRQFVSTPNGRGYSNYVDLHWAYISRDMERFSRLIKRCKDEFEKQAFQVEEAIEMEDIESAKRLLTSLPESLDKQMAPLVAVIENRKGDKSKAKAAFNEILDAMEQAGDSAIADIGRRAQKGPVPVSEFKDSPLSLAEKRIIGLAIHEFSADPSEEWKETIEAMNFSLNFPHNFIERMLQ